MTSMIHMFMISALGGMGDLHIGTDTSDRYKQ